MPILQSVASNVESTLAFTLSVKVVDIVGQLRGQISDGRDARDGSLILCVGILLLSIGSTFLSASSSRSPAKRFGTGVATMKKVTSRENIHAARSSSWSSLSPSLWWSRALVHLTPPTFVSKGLVDISSHVMVLSFSRLAMQQVRLSQFNIDPNTCLQMVVFQYTQRILEITFIGILLSSCITTLIPALKTMAQNKMAAHLGSAGRPGTDSSVESQLNSLIVNMQRTFAEAVTLVIPDVQTRKMVVLLGLCILPTISSVASGRSNPEQLFSMKRLGEFFVIFQGSKQGRGKRDTDRGNPSTVQENNNNNAPTTATTTATTWKTTYSILGKIWVAGLSMAWINTALSFILTSGSGATSLQAWISIVSTICLAVFTRALRPMFPGLEIFQGYIEWNVATSALNFVGSMSSRSNASLSNIAAVGCTGAAFYVVDLLFRETKRKEALRDMRNMGRNVRARGPSSVSANWRSPKMSITLETLQTVTILMFTNSLVSYSMQIISSSGHGQQAGSGMNRGSVSLGSIASQTATVITGLIVTKSLVQIINSSSCSKR